MVIFIWIAIGNKEYNSYTIVKFSKLQVVEQFFHIVDAEFRHFLLRLLDTDLVGNCSWSPVADIDRTASH